MKKTTVVILLALVALLAVWNFQVGQAQQGVDGPLIAVVNVTKVLTECQANLDREKLTRTKEQEIKTALAKLEAEAKVIQEELQNALEPGSDEYKNQLIKWFDKRAQREAYEKAQQQIFAAETQAWMENIYQQFVDKVTQIAQSQGISVVINNDDLDIKPKNLNELTAMIRSRKVLYHTPNLDLTALVTEELDLAYNQSKDDR